VDVTGPSINATMVPTDSLRPNPFQPRSDADQSDIDSLAESIARSGMLQPITVRDHDGQYQIIAGERRWWAARKIGMTYLPIIIRQASDEQMVELALIENIQREDLNAIDRAQAYRAFCARFGLKPDEVAARIGEDRSTVTNYLRLLDLPGPIRELVAAGDVSMGHARCLLGVADETRRWQLAESVVRNELSVRALEEVVRRERTRERGDGPPATKGRPARSPHLKDLEQRFEQAVHTKVTIREGRKKGTGRITIDYYSFDDFDRIAGLLGVSTD
jgi:ParB family chromosome partitioning protein